MKTKSKKSTPKLKSYIVTTTRTEFVSVSVLAKSKQDAIDIALGTDDEKWEVDSVEWDDTDGMTAELADYIP